MRLNGHSIYLRTGHYEDGTLGEIFVDVAKAGSAFRGLMDGMARLFSISLQYKVPLEALISAIKGISFEPSGRVEGEFTKVTRAQSMLDYVARELEGAYLSPPVVEAPVEQPIT